MYEPLSEEDMNLFYETSGIPVSCFADHLMTVKYGPNAQDFNLPMLLFSCMDKDLPSFWYSFTPEYIYMAGFQISKNLTVFLGPVLPAECSLKQAESICRILGRKPGEKFTLQQYFRQIPPHNATGLLSSLRLFSRLAGISAPAEIPCLPFQWNIPYPIQSYSHTPIIPEENTSDLEKILLSCIRSGNVTELNRIMNEKILFSGTYAPLSLNDMRSYILGANMLASRAAISAGLNYTLGNHLSGQYIAKILQSRTTDELTYIFFQIFQEYTRQIAELNEQTSDSPIVKRIYQYIHLHYDQQITSQIMADHLHMNCSYLCTLFKKETGMTLSHYIQSEKIREAKRLLEGSRFTIAEISSILAFSSQSYFCAVFKKITGMTPQSYRLSH